MKRPTNRTAILIAQDLTKLMLATAGENQWTYNLEVGQ